MSEQFQSKKTLLNYILLTAAVLIVGYAVIAPRSASSYGEVTQQQVGPAPPGLARATFAAGCFWSMEAIFSQLKGVNSVSPGYAGGTLAHPSYDVVEGGNTGYAESINIVYDPSVITYAELLKVLLIARNPTTLDQQGPDTGTQYRSIIFYRNSAQKAAADAAIKEISSEHLWPGPIVTEVDPFTTFYRAESYHLNYYNLHPDQPYCAEVIAPEIANFRAKFRTQLKS